MPASSSAQRGRRSRTCPWAKGGTQLNALMRTEASGLTGISTSFADGSGDAIGGALERGDVDALHLHHRVEGAPCPGGIGIADQLDELARNDLPRNAEAVFHPAALLCLGHCRERVGEAVDFGLSLRGYLERNRLIEPELWSAVQSGERPTHQRELDHQHVACLARRVVTRSAMDGIDTAVGEQRGVEISGLFGFAVEPETGGNGRHGFSS